MSGQQSKKINKWHKVVRRYQSYCLLISSSDFELFFHSHFPIKGLLQRPYLQNKVFIYVDSVYRFIRVIKSNLMKGRLEYTQEHWRALYYHSTALCCLLIIKWHWQEILNHVTMRRVTRCVRVSVYLQDQQKIHLTICIYVFLSRFFLFIIFVILFIFCMKLENIENIQTTFRLSLRKWDDFVMSRCHINNKILGNLFLVPTSSSSLCKFDKRPRVLKATHLSVTLCVNSHVMYMSTTS